MTHEYEMVEQNFLIYEIRLKRINELYKCAKTQLNKVKEVRQHLVELIKAEKLASFRSFAKSKPYCTVYYTAPFLRCKSLK
jgi:hypothetical protein